uniref:whey acidic protein-like isoform X1 n=2 Tax=Styela clava TaxID=7725 RepID=UPI001939D95A|nr:whey acidic protein-like isoform X1 [Styela clava]
MRPCTLLFSITLDSTMKYFLQFAMVLLTCMNGLTLANDVVLTCPDADSFGKICIIYRDQCMDNTACVDGQICCLVETCGRECVDPIPVALCPASKVIGPPCQGDETNECIDTPTNTGTNNICCYSGCSRIIATVPILDPGCRKVKGSKARSCIEECQSNYDCRKKKICCSNGCGTVCTPKKGKKVYR